MVESVVIQQEETGSEAPPEIVEEVQNVSEAAPDTDLRPEWLPEKFSSPEDMAKAYGELEQRLTKSSQDDNSIPDEGDQPSVEDAKEIVTDAGLDFDAMSKEYSETQELSNERYEQLAKAGIPKSVVDQYIAGQQAVGSQLRIEAESVVGGSENYGEMMDWASNSLSEGEVDQYNIAMRSGNRDAILMAVRGLQGRYNQENGIAPNLRHGASQAHSGDIYQSWAQVTADMANPEYEKDPVYRSSVEDRLARSGPLVSN